MTLSNLESLDEFIKFGDLESFEANLKNLIEMQGLEFAIKYVQEISNRNIDAHGRIKKSEIEIENKDINMRLSHTDKSISNVVMSCDRGNYVTYESLKVKPRIDYGLFNTDGGFQIKAAGVSSRTNIATLDVGGFLKEGDPRTYFITKESYFEPSTGNIILTQYYLSCMDFMKGRYGANYGSYVSIGNGIPDRKGVEIIINFLDEVQNWHSDKFLDGYNPKNNISDAELAPIEEIKSLDLNNIYSGLKYPKSPYKKSNMHQKKCITTSGEKDNSFYDAIITAYRKISNPETDTHAIFVTHSDKVRNQMAKKFITDLDE